jgi:hypothetical protein
VYLGGLVALISARNFALNPGPMLVGEDVPTTGMLMLMGFVIFPAVALVLLGMLLPANPEWRGKDKAIALAGLLVFLLILGSGTVIVVYR